MRNGAEDSSSAKVVNNKEGAAAAAPWLVGPQPTSGASEDFFDDFGAWNSVRLKLLPEDNFHLELWRFEETFCYHSSDQAAMQARQAQREGQPATHQMLEVQATLTGRVQRRPSRAFEVRGAMRRELSTVFVEDPSLDIAGQPTFWSLCGHFFAYYIEDHRHWKVNAVKAAGGDGFQRVAPGKMRAACGWLHSDIVRDGKDPVEALLSTPDNWFELSASSGDWEPSDLQVSEFHGAKVLRFTTDKVTIDETMKAGQEECREKTSINEALSFQAYVCPERSGDVRLCIPEIPVTSHLEGPVLQEQTDADEAVPTPTFNVLGDPGFALLRTNSRL